MAQINLPVWTLWDTLINMLHVWFEFLWIKRYLLQTYLLFSPTPLQDLKFVDLVQRLRLQRLKEPFLCPPIAGLHSKVSPEFGPNHWKKKLELMIRLHRGWKGPFNYFQLCFLIARVNFLNITRYLRSNKVKIVEF